MAHGLVSTANVGCVAVCDQVAKCCDNLNVCALRRAGVCRPALPPRGCSTSQQDVGSRAQWCTRAAGCCSSKGAGAQAGGQCRYCTARDVRSPCQHSAVRPAVPATYPKRACAAVLTHFASNVRCSPDAQHVFAAYDQCSPSWCACACRMFSS